MSRLRRSCLVSAAAAVLLAPVLLAVPAEADDGSDLTGLSYVALGDSYASGMGLPLAVAQPAPGCFQSDQDYPHQLADQLGLDLDDRSCAGATTENVTTTPQTTVGGSGTAPVQLDAVAPDTALVTLTIGGNDLGFAQVTASCLAQSPSGPLLVSPGAAPRADCRSLYVSQAPAGEVDTLRQMTDQRVGPLLASTLAQIAARAPRAAIVVVGYPALAPDPANTPAAGCFSGALPSATGTFPVNAYPFTDVDTAYLFETQSHLDAVMASTVEKAGAVYVSALDGSVAHSPCAATAPYVNGVTLTSPGAPGSTTPSNSPVGVRIGSLHPNTEGVSFLTQQALAGVRLAFTKPGPEPSPSVTDSPTSSPTVSTSPSPSVSATPAGVASSRQLAATGSPSVLPVLLLGLGVVSAGVALTVRRLPRRRR